MAMPVRVLFKNFCTNDGSQAARFCERTQVYRHYVIMCDRDIIGPLSNGVLLPSNYRLITTSEQKKFWHPSPMGVASNPVDQKA